MTDETRAPPSRRARRRLAALACGLALAAGLGEVGARVAVAVREDLTPPPPAAVDPYAENPYLQREAAHLYFHLPGARYRQTHADYQVDYAINGRGFRGPDWGPKPAGVRRLLVVGDSMVEGHGVAVDETFAAQLDLAGWEVLNVGVQGASPIYYAANLARYLALEPDAVLLVSFANDLAEDRIRELSYHRGRRLVTAPAQLGYGAWPTSYAWALLPRPRPLAERVAAHDARLGVPDGGEARKAARRAEGAALADYLVPPERLDDHVAISVDYLDLVADGLAEAGVEVCVAHLSLDFAWHGRPPAFREQARRHAQALQAWADARGHPLLRLDERFGPAFAQAERPSLVFPADPHLTPLGHTQVAAVLGPWLSEQLDAPLTPASGS